MTAEEIMSDVAEKGEWELEEQLSVLFEFLDDYCNLDEVDEFLDEKLKEQGIERD